MRELSLFTGAGGGIWASKLLGWKTIGYVEINEYCQKVIRARIDDGSFDRAPIFTDVREFVESGAAEQYRGFADVVSGGFPCQPFSIAGKQLGSNDERDMWPATRDLIRAVRPSLVFLENVPAILVFRYFGGILSDLAESGYCVQWLCLSGSDVGAVHRRERVWIHATNSRSSGVQRDVAEKVHRFKAFPWGENIRTIEDVRERSSVPAPMLCRNYHGLAHGSNRIAAIGNGQIPRVAATAWRILTGTAVQPICTYLCNSCWHTTNDH
jgi:DNA (cytosine-5)-methyltransferase 1